MAEVINGVTIYDWDDEITDDGSGGFVTLDEGDYEFTVTAFERTNYTPSSKAKKTPACRQATMTLRIETDEGTCYIKDNFPLASTMEWKASSFLRSIGLKQHGEGVKWEKFEKEAIGCKGRAHVTKEKGTQREGVWFNNVSQYIDPPAKKKDDKEEDDEWS